MSTKNEQGTQAVLENLLQQWDEFETEQFVVQSVDGYDAERATQPKDEPVLVNTYEGGTTTALRVRYSL